MPAMTNGRIALNRTWNTTPAWADGLLHVGVLGVSALIKFRSNDTGKRLVLRLDGEGMIHLKLALWQDASVRRRTRDGLSIG